MFRLKSDCTQQDFFFAFRHCLKHTRAKENNFFYLSHKMVLIQTQWHKLYISVYLKLYWEQKLTSAQCSVHTMIPEIMNHNPQDIDAAYDVTGQHWLFVHVMHVGPITIAYFRLQCNSLCSNVTFCDCFCYIVVHHGCSCR